MAIPVVKATLLREGRSGYTSTWDVVLQCGHEIKGRKQANGGAPRFAGCPHGCTPDPWEVAADWWVTWLRSKEALIVRFTPPIWIGVHGGSLK